ncbi:MAG TPA: HAD family phosphatase [Candidatus Paceibacterota bacterium]|nr:HAD family phosphatase [Candidatus Paceibacterota bacterium]
MDDPRKPAAVIFDMNGVIVDDEALHARAFVEVMRRHGFELTQDYFVANCMGRTDEEGFANLGAVFSAALDVPRLIREKAAIYASLVAGEGRHHAYPGVIDFIKRCAEHYKLALVSSALASEVRETLAEFGVADRFAVIVAAEDVAHGKPHPEPYLLAAQKLGVAPAACVVIEDTPAGIQSAKSAGMMAIGVANTHPKADLAAADRIVTTVEETGLLDNPQRDA